MSSRWRKEEFWEQLKADKVNRKYEDIARQILEQTEKLDILQWSERGKDASFVGMAKTSEHLCIFYQVWARNERGGNGIEIMYRNIKKPFHVGTELQEQWETRLVKAGFPLGDNKGRRNFSFYHLSTDKKLLPKFFETVEWALKQLGIEVLQTGGIFSNSISEKKSVVTHPIQPSAKNTPDIVSPELPIFSTSDLDDVSTYVDYLSDRAASSVEEYQPTYDDERVQTYRQIKERRGQQKFRDALLVMYQGTCPITGCTVAAALEAAHIVPHRSENDNNPENGLLLRADVHTLFDLNLIGIEPETCRIHLHPSFKPDIAYRRQLQEGKQIPIFKQASPTTLQYRWKLFLERKSRPA